MFVLLLFALALALSSASTAQQDRSGDTVNNDSHSATSCSCGASRDQLASSPFPLNLNLNSVSDSTTITTATTTTTTTSTIPRGRLFDETVLIPGGTFQMGLKEPILVQDGEGSQRYVTVNSFRIDQYEVCNEQFRQFIEATQFKTENELFGWSFVFDTAIPPHIRQNITQAVKGAEWWLPVNGSTWLEPEGPGTNVFETNRSSHPVVQVTWNDAVAFCAWKGKRLPTEAEWEYAAQGKSVGKTSTYPWGDKLAPKGVFKANVYQGKFPYHSKTQDGYEFTAPVDAFGEQNDYGLYNIVGNVWEWVEDWYTNDHSYLKPKGSSVRRAIVNPHGPTTGKDRVKRSGSFLCHKSYCYRYRTASRYHTTPDSASSNTGFRCVQDVTKEEEQQQQQQQQQQVSTDGSKDSLKHSNPEL